MSNKDDLEELLKLAELPPNPEDKVEDKLTIVREFCADLKIEAGDTPVPAKVIYYHYLEWRKNKYPHRRGYIMPSPFFKEFKSYYLKQHDQINKYSHYWLKPTSFDLTINHWKIRQRINEVTKKTEVPRTF